MVIFGGDAVVGRTLELLLTDASCSAKFVGEPCTSELRDLLVGVRLVLLAPAVRETWRKEFLKTVRSTMPLANMPIMELVSIGNKEVSAQEGRVVLWPCPIEDLKKEVETTLSSKSHSANLQEDSA